MHHTADTGTVQRAEVLEATGRTEAMVVHQVAAVGEEEEVVTAILEVGMAWASCVMARNVRLII